MRMGGKIISGTKLVLFLLAVFLLIKAAGVKAEAVKAVELRGALVLSESDDLEEYNTNNNSSLGLGFKIVKRLHPNFYYQLGLNLSYTRVSLESDEFIFGGSIHFDEKIKLVSLEAPLLIKMPFNPDNIYSSSLYFGAEPGVFLSDKRSGDYLLTADNEEFTGSYESSIGNLRVYKVGIVTGFEKFFKIGNSFYSLDLRYTKNLLKSFEKVEDIPQSYSNNENPFVDKNGNAIDMILNSFTISISRYF